MRQGKKQGYVSITFGMRVSVTTCIPGESHADGGWWGQTRWRPFAGRALLRDLASLELHNTSMFCRISKATFGSKVVDCLRTKAYIDEKLYHDTGVYVLCGLDASSITCF